MPRRRHILLVLPAVASLAIAATIAWGASIHCHSGGDCNGTNHADTITGTSDTDFIKARGGPDTVHGGGQYDNISGGRGNDVLHGDGGAESPLLGRVSGDGGDDRVYGDAGDDGNLFGGAGKDKIFGGEGDDTVDGYSYESTEERDVLDCGPGEDTATMSPSDKVKDNCENLVVKRKALSPR
jgi:hypothetical protein